ncbi:MAG: mannitol dehydrogenase family protein, partial [Lachnospiraceae bacterium]|nr:mannitol dehydrogenase family protein [Lachnospiraceae bacterium]
NMNPITLSPDPLLEELMKLPKEQVLKRTDVFGVDLFADSLGRKALMMYEELSAGKGAVRKTLIKYI